MKKLLSILSAIGLVATASTSVVSCTKTSELPTYHDVSDISGSFLNSNEMLAKGDTDSKNVIATIANSFKNPKDVLNANLTATAGKTTAYTGYNIIEFKITKEGSKTSSTVLMKQTTNDMTYLKSGDKQDFKIDVSAVDKSVPSVLNGIYREVKELKPDNFEDYKKIKSQASELMSMDISLINNATDKFKDKLPGFDTNDGGLRFDSVNQQIIASYSNEPKTQQLKNGFSSWKEKMIDLNAAILDAMNGINPKKDILEASDYNKIFNTEVLKILNSNSYINFSVDSANSEEAN